LCNREENEQFQPKYAIIQGLILGSKSQEKTIVAAQQHRREEALPMTREEMNRRGWDELDVLLVTGDAYVDHPSFGAALLGRWLESKGYRVGIVAQPRWDTTADIECMGRPRLFAGVTAGAMDSMVNHYTAFRKKRHDDAYTPGGRSGARPNRATIAYTGRVRQAFPGLPVVIGGIESSLRRATHYDFWDDKLHRSILLDSKADLLVYGMGERAILEVARRLEKLAPGEKRPPETLRGIHGTVFVVSSVDALQGIVDVPTREDFVQLPSHEAIQGDAALLMEATLAIERQVHHGTEWAVQECGGRHVVMTPPADLLDTAELDALYALPFTRSPHPSYREPIPAAEMIQFSVTAHRGCAGGCTFCSITLHQGRQIRSRSAASLESEVRGMTRHRDWRGAVSDVGGPTANMWGARCTADHTTCRRTDCLTPEVCPNFDVDEAAQVRLLRNLRNVPGVRHLRVASGVRYDIAGDNGRHLRTLVGEFVGGQLKIAPEHFRDRVLRLMRKPRFEKFEAFLNLFDRETQRAGKEQYVIPYLISAFPGCTDPDMVALAKWLKDRGWQPKQVQCFMPTPGTVATAMYYAGIDPDGDPIYVAKTDAARLRQHGILIPERNAPEPKPMRRDGRR
jgi:uncharacterized radical SAM protein YgiQ